MVGDQGDGMSVRVGACVRGRGHVVKGEGKCVRGRSRACERGRGGHVGEIIIRERCEGGNVWARECV